jgi:hypothetical protein
VVIIYFTYYLLWLTFLHSTVLQPETRLSVIHSIVRNASHHKFYGKNSCSSVERQLTNRKSSSFLEETLNLFNNLEPGALVYLIFCYVRVDESTVLYNMKAYQRTRNEKLATV